MSGLRSFRGARVGAAALALLTLGAGLTACGGDDDADTKITVGATPILNAAPLYLGIEQGIFADAGLDVEVQQIQTAATAVPSLINGELDYALVSQVPTLTARGQDLPIAAVSGNDVYTDDPAQDGAALLVAADSPVQSGADLADSTIAVVGLRGMPELVTRVYLENNGVDPASVEFVEIPYPEMVTAVADGRVDAALVADPFLAQGEAQGLRAAGHPFSEAFPGVSGLLWVGNETEMSGDSEATEQFQEAMTEAIQYAADHPDEVLEIAQDFTQMDAATLETVKMPVFDGEVTQESIDTVATAMVEQGFADSEPDTDGLVWQP